MQRRRFYRFRRLREGLPVLLRLRRGPVLPILGAEVLPRPQMPRIRLRAVEVEVAVCLLSLMQVPSLLTETPMVVEVEIVVMEAMAVVEKVMEAMGEAATTPKNVLPPSLC